MMKYKEWFIKTIDSGQNWPSWPDKPNLCQKPTTLSKYMARATNFYARIVGVLYRI